MSRKKILTAVFLLISGNITILKGEGEPRGCDAEVTEKYDSVQYVYEEESGIAEDKPLINEYDQDDKILSYKGAKPEEHFSNKALLSDQETLEGKIAKINYKPIVNRVDNELSNLVGNSEKHEPRAREDINEPSSLVESSENRETSAGVDINESSSFVENNDKKEPSAREDINEPSSYLDNNENYDASTPQEKSIIKSKKFIDFMRMKSAPSTENIPLEYEDQKQPDVGTWRAAMKKRKHTIGHFRPGKKSGLDYLHVKNNVKSMEQKQKMKMRPVLEVPASLFSERLFRRLVGTSWKEKIPQCFAKEMDVEREKSEENENSHKVRRREWNKEMDSEENRPDKNEVTIGRSGWLPKYSSSLYSEKLNEDIQNTNNLNITDYAYYLNTRQKRLTNKDKEQRMALYNNNINFDENMEKGLVKNNENLTYNLYNPFPEIASFHNSEIIDENMNTHDVKKFLVKDLSVNESVSRPQNLVEKATKGDKDTMTNIHPLLKDMSNIIAANSNNQMVKVNSEMNVEPMQFLNPSSDLSYNMQPNSNYILYPPIKLQSNILPPLPISAMYSNMYPQISSQYLSQNPSNGTNLLTPQKELAFNVIAPNPASHDLITISIDPKTLTDKILHAEFLKKTDESKDLEMGKNVIQVTSNNKVKIFEPDPHDMSTAFEENLHKNDLNIVDLEKKSEEKEILESAKTDPQLILEERYSQENLTSHKNPLAGQNLQPMNNDEIREKEILESIKEQTASVQDRRPREIKEENSQIRNDEGSTSNHVKRNSGIGCGNKVCSQLECSLIPICENPVCRRTTLSLNNFKELNEGRRKRKAPYRLNRQWMKDCSTTVKPRYFCNNPCLGKKKTINKRDMSEELLNVIKPVILLKPEEEESEEDTSRDSSMSLDKGNKKMENKILEGFINSIISNYSRGEIKSDTKKTAETTSADKETLGVRDMSKIVKDILKKGEEMPEEWGLEPLVVPEESLPSYLNNKEYAKLGPFDERIIRSLFQSQPIKIMATKQNET